MGYHAMLIHVVPTVRHDVHQNAVRMSQLYPDWDAEERREWMAQRVQFRSLKPVVSIWLRSYLEAVGQSYLYDRTD